MGFLGLFVAFSIQGFLIFRFIASFLKSRRESREQSAKLKKVKAAEVKQAAAVKKDRKKESDLPEADQNTNVSVKKVKTK